MSLPKLPSTLTVLVNGAECQIAGKPNNAKTRIWYSGSTLVEELVANAADLLAKIAVSFNGTVLKAGDVHTSAPRLYGRDHAKAGQAMPNTGGNLTVTHSLVISLVDETTGEKIPFTLMVTVTYVADKGFRVTAKAIPQAEREPTMVVSGLSFAGASA